MLRGGEARASQAASPAVSARSWSTGGIIWQAECRRVWLYSRIHAGTLARCRKRRLNLPSTRHGT